MSAMSTIICDGVASDLSFEDSGQPYEPCFEEVSQQLEPKCQEVAVHWHCDIDRTDIKIKNSAQSRKTLDEKDVPIFPCDKCSKTFIRKSNLKQHLLVHDDVKAHTCPECGKKFRYKQGFQIHMTTHGRSSEDGVHIKYYTCEKCGRRFNCRSNYSRHYRTHDRVRVPSCQDCGKKFRLLQSFQFHRAKHGGQCGEESSEKHICDKCGKIFTCMSNLRQHLLVHNNSKTHACPECGKTYKFEQSVKLHMKTHGGGYDCIKCGEKFDRKNHLKKHLKVNHEAEPKAIEIFTCPECGKHYKWKPSFRDHMAMHKEPAKQKKKYKCDKCDAVYSGKTSLANHRKNNRCWASYECLDCICLLSDKIMFMKHLNDCHKAKTLQTREFGCTICYRWTSLICTSKAKLDERKWYCYKCFHLRDKPSNPSIVSDDKGLAKYTKSHLPSSNDQTSGQGVILNKTSPPLSLSGVADMMPPIGSCLVPNSETQVIQSCEDNIASKGSSILLSQGGLLLFPAGVPNALATLVNNTAVLVTKPANFLGANTAYTLPGATVTTALPALNCVSALPTVSNNNSLPVVKGDSLCLTQSDATAFSKEVELATEKKVKEEVEEVDDDEQIFVTDSIV